MKVLRADILHDVGQSINPAIDIGQIEGGFVQGMGWLTTEELYWQPQGPHAGRLFTHAPSTYKIPTSVDIPHIFNVKLFNNQNQADTIYRSKAVGEPPLCWHYRFLCNSSGSTGGYSRKCTARTQCSGNSRGNFTCNCYWRGQALAARPQAKM